MRIGIYDPYLDDLGGGEKYMMSIAQALSQKHSVDVLWDNINDRDLLLKRFSLDLSRVNFVKNIFSPHVSLLERFWKSKMYDALIVLSDGSIPLVASRKLFLHIQQPLEDSQTKNWWGRLKMSRVSNVFCNSHFTKDFIDKVLHVNAKVIYPPVPIHAKKIKKENIVLHVGRFRVANIGITDYKKQSVMVDAFKHMVDKGLKNWTFVLAVSFMEKEKDAFLEMEQQAKGYPIEFLVNKTNDELWDIYSKAKIYWHASGYGEDLIKHPEYAEHFGISTVEAMGAGAVPVVINAGGQKEIVTDGEDGLLWNSIEQLQEKTLQVIQDKTLLQKLSANAQKRAKDFSFERFSGAINNLVR